VSRIQLVFPQPGGPVINQVFCMARGRQARMDTGLGMGIILTMPDQMTPVIESSVEVVQGFCGSSAMPVSAKKSPLHGA
jgi:hypothetical protein